MSTEANKAIVRRIFDEVFNQKNMAAADELYAPDYVHHDPNLPPVTQKGREAYKQGLGMFIAALPDFRMTLDDLVAEGDRVAFRWTFHGTSTGELMGIPPTGKSVTITASQTLRIAGDKAVEGWVNFDALGMMQQLGAIPAPAEAAG